jgi:hypothetical protein
MTENERELIDAKQAVVYAVEAAAIWKAAYERQAEYVALLEERLGQWQDFGAKVRPMVKH